MTSRSSIVIQKLPSRMPKLWGKPVVFVALMDALHVANKVSDPPMMKD